MKPILSEDLVLTLAQAAAKELQAKYQLLDFNDVRSSIALFKAMETAGTVAADLKAAVLQDDSFGALRGGWLNAGGHGFALQDYQLAAALLRVCMVDGPIEWVIAEARALSSSLSAPTTTYFPISSVRLNEQVDFEDWHVVPWGAVPECYQKELFDGRRGLGVAFPLMVARATAAISRPKPSSQVLFDTAAEAIAKMRLPPSSDPGRLDQNDIARCLGALASRPVTLLGNWEHSGSLIIREMAGSSYSYGADFLDGMFPREPAELTGQEAIDLLSKWVALPDAHRLPLRIALDRITRSQRPKDLVNRAIDIGIALEALALHELGDGADRGELRYRIAIRMASYLGEKGFDPEQVFRDAKKAYQVRSKAVHEGRIEPNEKVLGVLDRAEEMAIAMAVGIVKGGFPDWDRHVLRRLGPPAT